MPEAAPANVMVSIVSLCKRRGFVYPASEIYGGLNGFWDYGPLGVLLKNNIRDHWWRNMVECPPLGPDGHPVDMVGIDTAIIQNPKTWVASGHVGGFSDPMVDDRETKQRYRADHVMVMVPKDKQGNAFAFLPGEQEVAEKKIKREARRNPEDYEIVALTKLPLDQFGNIVAPATKTPGTLTEPRAFNLMFITYVGALQSEDSKSYLRPETAQGIFLNFKNVVDTTRVKIPFGVAQIGKTFRNEVTPRNFIFRSREFEQMEMEWFCHPDEAPKWYDFWKVQRMNWWRSLGVKESNLRLRDHEADELSHYSKMTVDIEYLYPFTAPDFGELEGIAHRGCFDLTQHQTHSGQKLDYFDQDLQLKLKEQGASPEEIKSKSRYIPNVIEPASGLTRAVLVVLCESYRREPGRQGTEELLSIKPQFAPIKAGIFPLVNKEGMPEVAEKLYMDLRQAYTCEYDPKQSIGKRYARMDEIGTPFCFTIDGDTLKDQTVTVRERDSMSQERIGIDKVKSYLAEKLGVQESLNMQFSWRREGLICVVLAMVTFTLFAQTRHHDYLVYDDPQYVQRNDRVLRGLSWDNTRWAFTTMRMANWHPLAWMSHMLDVELFGPDPGPQHLVSAGIHAINALLVFLVLSSLTRGTWCAALVAVLFAVHPLRMESVAWIAERKDLLCAMFFFIAIGCYGQYVRRSSWAWYTATLAAFVLGILSKPMIVTFPCVLLLLDYWPLKRPVRLRLIIEKLPFVAISIGASIVTYVAQQKSGAMEPATYPMPIRIANAVWAYGRYLCKTFLPTDLAAFYPYYGVVRGTQFPWPRAAICGVVLLLITAIAIALWRRGERSVLIGWLWFLGILVPTIGLVQVGSQSMADRYSYLPQLGLLIALIYGGAAMGERWPAIRKLLAASACVFAGMLAISTAYQLRYWKNSDTLFRHAMEVTDHNATANVSIALYLTLHRDLGDPVPFYNAALELSPGMAEAHSNLGALLGERGETDPALDHLLVAVKLDPKYAEARNNLGNLLSRLGRVPQALHQYGEAAKLDPDSSEIHYNLAMTLSQAGRYEEAARQFAEALRLRPNYAQARFGLALALVASGQVEAGKRQFEGFIQQKPDAVDAMAQFAWALATSPDPRSRDPRGAIALAAHVNQLTLSERAEYLDTLAAALASAGQFDRAVAAATRAVELARAHGQADLADRIGKRLELYRSGQPFVTTPLPIATTNPENSHP